MTDVRPVPPRPVLKAAITVLIQALLWCALTLAFAALLTLAGPQSWTNALRFSAFNWMPWVVLAPLVFWFSSLFPLERGHLLKSIPAHALGCVSCVAITLWFVTSFAFLPRPQSRPEERTPPALERSATLRNPTERIFPDRPSPERGTLDRDLSHPSPAPGDEPPRPPRRFVRELYARRGPFWWPFLGTTLLRANFDAAIYLIVVVAAHALAFYRRAQERERDAMALAAGLNRAKLDALRLQLQPHFLFNTLNAISTLVHRNANAADELIGDLSELLRVSLQTSENEVPLGRELELLDRYLAIEQTRLGDRLRIVRDIDSRAVDGFVPTFVLQPLVENAIRHGIEPRLAPGTITVRARRSGPSLLLAVTDDGVGLRPDVKNGRRGIGISNTEARLRALHGDAAKLSLATPVGGGVEVQIALPFSTQRKPDPAEATT